MKTGSRLLPERRAASDVDRDEQTHAGRPALLARRGARHREAVRARAEHLVVLGRGRLVRAAGQHVPADTVEMRPALPGVHALHRRRLSLQRDSQRVLEDQVSTHGPTIFFFSFPFVLFWGETKIE